MQIDEIIFCDTGMEFPYMYKHIEKVKFYIQRDISIIKSDKTYEYYLGYHIKTKGKNKGKIGYGHPDFRNRWCTTMLKIIPYKKFLKKYKEYNIIEYHGIAKDEEHRTKNNQKNRIIKYPLVEWNITEKEALNYCYKKGFDWNGLYKDFKRVSCFCCPLSRLKELELLYFKYPNLWKKIKELDKLSYRKFKSDYSIEELEYKFEQNKK